MKLKAIHNSIAPRRAGGIPLTDNTLQTYEKHYDSLFFFFSQIKDYESLLMLRKYSMEYFPSMTPTSIILHHKWKIGKKGSALLDDRGKEVLDLDGKGIRCVGIWISTENLEQCWSAISTLHKAGNMIEAYQKPCGQSIELDMNGNYHGCRFNCNNSKLWTAGSTNNCLDVYNWRTAFIQ